MKNTQGHTALRAFIVTLGTVGLLAACGGGGGSDASSTEPTPTPTVFTPSKLQGRWSSTGATAATSYTAIILPGAGNTANVWLLSQNLSHLNVLSLNDQAVFSGKTYALGSSSTPITATGTVVADLTSSTKILSLNGANSEVLQVTLQDALTQPASLADTGGNWTGSVSSGVQTLNFSIASQTGILSGTSTTGCTYSGNLVAVSNANAFTSTLNENCPDGSTANFEGIATLNTDKNRLTIVAATLTQTSGLVLLLSK